MNDYFGFHILTMFGGKVFSEQKLMRNHINAETKVNIFIYCLTLTSFAYNNYFIIYKFV